MVRPILQNKGDHAVAFAPIVSRFSLWHIGWRIVVWRLKRIKLRQSLRHATGHDKLGLNPKFRAHHQCDHLP
tara:strand:+ start:912 stop:1127 length:216 start_codon:yes stop_codon:yes gene_type:complete